MEHKGKVVTLDIGDYYAFVDYKGIRYLVGCSSDSRSLFSFAVRYAKTYCSTRSVVRVFGIRRTSLGVRPYIVFKKSFVVCH